MHTNERGCVHMGCVRAHVCACEQKYARASEGVGTCMPARACVSACKRGRGCVHASVGVVVHARASSEHANGQASMQAGERACKQPGGHERGRSRWRPQTQQGLRGFATAHTATGRWQSGLHATLTQTWRDSSDGGHMSTSEPCTGTSTNTPTPPLIAPLKKFRGTVLVHFSVLGRP